MKSNQHKHEPPPLWSLSNLQQQQQYGGRNFVISGYPTTARRAAECSSRESADTAQQPGCGNTGRARGGGRSKPGEHWNKRTRHCIRCHLRDSDRQRMASTGARPEGRAGAFVYERPDHTGAHRFVQPAVLPEEFRIRSAFLQSDEAEDWRTDITPRIEASIFPNLDVILANAQDSPKDFVHCFVDQGWATSTEAVGPLAQLVQQHLRLPTVQRNLTDNPTSRKILTFAIMMSLVQASEGRKGDTLWIGCPVLPHQLLATIQKSVAEQAGSDWLAPAPDQTVQLLGEISQITDQARSMAKAIVASRSADWAGVKKLTVQGEELMEAIQLFTSLTWEGACKAAASPDLPTVLQLLQQKERRVTQQTSNPDRQREGWMLPASTSMGAVAPTFVLTREPADGEPKLTPQERDELEEACKDNLTTQIEIDRVRLLTEATRTSIIALQPGGSDITRVKMPYYAEAMLHAFQEEMGTCSSLRKIPLVTLAKVLSLRLTQNDAFIFEHLGLLVTEDFSTDVSLTKVRGSRHDAQVIKAKRHKWAAVNSLEDIANIVEGLALCVKRFHHPSVFSYQEIFDLWFKLKALFVEQGGHTLVTGLYNVFKTRVEEHALAVRTRSQESDRELPPLTTLQKRSQILYNQVSKAARQECLRDYAAIRTGTGETSWGAARSGTGTVDADGKRGTHTRTPKASNTSQAAKTSEAPTGTKPATTAPSSKRGSETSAAASLRGPAKRAKRAGPPAHSCVRCGHDTLPQTDTSDAVTFRSGGVPGRNNTRFAEGKPTLFPEERELTQSTGQPHARTQSNPAGNRWALAQHRLDTSAARWQQCVLVDSLGWARTRRHPTHKQKQTGTYLAPAYIAKGIEPRQRPFPLADQVPTTATPEMPKPPPKWLEAEVEMHLPSFRECLAQEASDKLDAATKAAARDEAILANGPVHGHRQRARRGDRAAEVRIGPDLFHPTVNKVIRAGHTIEIPASGKPRIRQLRKLRANEWGFNASKLVKPGSLEPKSGGRFRLVWNASWPAPGSLDSAVKLGEQWTPIASNSRTTLPLELAFEWSAIEANNSAIDIMADGARYTGATLLGRTYDLTKWFRQLAMTTTDLWKCTVYAEGGFREDRRMQIGRRSSAHSGQRTTFLLIAMLQKAAREEKWGLIDADECTDEKEKQEQQNLRAWLDQRSKIRTNNLHHPVSAEAATGCLVFFSSFQDDILALALGRRAAEHVTAGVPRIIGTRYEVQISDKEEASKDFSTSFDAIGAAYDTSDPRRIECSPKPSKLAKYAELIEQLKNAGPLLQLREMQQFVGLHTFMARFLDEGEFYCNSAYCCLRAIPNTKGDMRPVSKALLSDANTVLTHLRARKLAPLTETPIFMHPGHQGFSADASGATEANAYGWGVHVQGTMVRGKWPAKIKQALKLQKVSISPLELLAAAIATRVALQNSHKLPRSRRVILRSDSESACSVANSKRADSAPMLEALRIFKEVADEGNIKVRLQYIPTKDNIIADRLSRGEPVSTYPQPQATPGEGTAQHPKELTQWHSRILKASLQADRHLTDTTNS